MQRGELFSKCAGVGDPLRGFPFRRRRLPSLLAAALLAPALPVLLLLAALPAGAMLNADGPDIIVGDLQNISNFTSSSGIDAFAVGTTSCNIGNETLRWIDDTNKHPVIGQNMYRLRDDRLEQIGMSWLKHGFTALQEEECSSDCEPFADGTALGVNCSDPYSATLNGTQEGLGPRSEVNPTTGVFPYPPGDPSFSGGIARRLQVHVDDLNPSLNSGALYFVEGHYVHPDDAKEGNGNNNVSHRRVTISTVTSGVNYSASLTGSTFRESPAIEAWQNQNDEVTILTIQSTDGEAHEDGRFVAGYLVSENNDGTWHYEYAVYNMNCDRAAGSFTVPLPVDAVITNIGFHDVDYHSGEPFDGSDWEATVTPTEIHWQVAESFDENADANALRWGTLYNFRFDCDLEPTFGDLTLGLFKPSPNGAADELLFEGAHPDGLFIPPVDHLVAAAVPAGVLLSWFNMGEYDDIEIERDGEPLTSIAGAEFSYLDEDATPGNHRYGVVGIVAGDPSVARSASIDVPAADGPGFVYQINDLEAEFAALTGVGSLTAELLIAEDADHAGYPNAMDGFSMALAYDPVLLTPTSTSIAAALSEVNSGAGPSFFAGEIWDDGVSVAAIFSFEQTETLSVGDPTVVATVDFDTNPETLAAVSQDAATVLQWRDGIGNGKLVNEIVVDLAAFDPEFANGTITLRRIGALAESFLRGDINGDGSFTLVDPIRVLQYMFSGGQIPCLDAADINDNGSIALGDPILLLGYMFNGGVDPQPPFPACGEDPTADGAKPLDCSGVYPGCD